MTYKFQSLYFDGVRSSPRLSTVEITPDSLLVTLPREGESPEEFLITGADLKHSGFHSLGHGEVCTLRIGSSGVRSLEVREPGFRDALLTLPPTGRPRGLKEKRLKPLFITALVGSLAAALLLAWFVVVPAVGDAVGNNLPRDWENSLSLSLEDSLVKEFPVDDELTAKLHEYVGTLNLPGSEEKRFYVCESSHVNAFAVMGNAIFVFKPMLSTLDSSDEMAALLFHEWAHLELRHTSRTTMRTLASYFVISLFMGDSSGVLAVLLQNLDTLQRLQYSREFETEADQRAAELLAERGLDPQALPRLLEKLKAEEENLPEVLEFLSTHPDMDQRINQARTLGVQLASEARKDTLALGDHQFYWDQLKLKK